MNDIVQIALPLPHIRSVNTWLLRGDPLTLVDTGPRSDEALSALEAGLRDAGARLEDLELVLVTHHHLDHAGLAATIAQRSDARIAALEPVAAYGERYDERAAADRNFSRALIRHHGVPDSVIAASEGFWDYIRDNSEAFATDVRLGDGDTIRAGGRDLRALHRPGHSTTDTLLVDDRDRLAFVGDHLLGRVSSNTEIYPAVEPTGTRPPARVEYLANLRRTARMPLERLLTGHGDPVLAHALLVRRRFADHERRCGRIAAALEAGPATAFEIAHRLWPARTVREQPLLVVWEVLGHLDLLLGADAVREAVTDDGSRHGIARFELVHRRRPSQRPVRARDLCSLDTHEPEAHGGGRPARAS
jgi:glyoxylase-like metal-dependent hydrolase (beta-lactamase superfamily II)